MAVLCLGLLSMDMKQVVKPSELASTAVKRVIADLEECKPSQLGTLSQQVNIDELNAIIDSSPHDGEEKPQSITFRYCGYAIEVYSDRTVHISN